MTAQRQLVAPVDDLEGSHGISAFEQAPITVDSHVKLVAERAECLQAAEVWARQKRRDRFIREVPGDRRGLRLAALGERPQAVVVAPTAAVTGMGVPHEEDRHTGNVTILTARETISDMSFFERNRKQLAEIGIDPARLPPGQYHTERFPVLHVGNVPNYDMSKWTFQVFGEVDQPHKFSWDEFRSLPTVEVTTDIHCVTKWSKFDTVWKGVLLRDLFDLAKMRPVAQHVIMHAEGGYTANVPLADAVGDKCLVAYEYDGQPLEGEHGYPARTLIPHLYFWKSVKWIRAIELSTTDKPGFWEVNGYHNYGDPFLEQRHWGD